MLIIQLVAALLLLLGSGLIFKALAEIDGPVRPKPIIRPRLDSGVVSRHPARAQRVRDRLPKAA